MHEQVIIECEECHKELIAGAPDDREEIAYGHCHGCGGYLRIKGVRRFAPAARPEAQGEDEDSLVKEAVALIDEAVSEIAGDCQCYEEDGEVVVCWTCRAMNWSDRAARQQGGSE